MLNSKQIERMLGKLARFESTLEPFMFKKVGEVPMSAYQCMERLTEIPAKELFAPVEKGFTWGGEGAYCWFKGEYTIPQELDGKDVFLRPHIGGQEAMLWVDGMPFGIFASKFVEHSHGNHYSNMIKKNAKTGETVAIDLEYYAWHYVKGLLTFEESGITDFTCKYDGVDICLKDDYIIEFYFDLKVLNQQAKILSKDSFRRANVVKALAKVHEIVYYSVENVDWEDFIDALKQAHPYLKEALSATNSQSAPLAALIGHCHMDTAWLWTIDETRKKCARTYSNQMSLMEQYPEYKFIQSSAYHGDMIRRDYPQLFEKIKERVAEGRYEPNGGVWVECDCNITSGESMIRQFLWGQRFTRKHFNYTSNCFWLPDTFGYSAAIPQIMKGCGVDYFLTTKMAWNDTNKFPYDTFYWQGLDGTKVLAHLNKTHMWPDAESLMEYCVGGEADDPIMEKTVSNMRLLSYGIGDGGGGPQFEMIETSRRLKDLEGSPRSEYMLVGDFMEKLEETIDDPTTYNGELYLELHRGTLTSQHQIKRNNRKAEVGLRNLEYLTVYDAVKNSKVAESKDIEPLQCTLLVNQFHDILPGTCIPAAHDQSVEEMTEVIETAESLVQDIVSKDITENKITLINTLSFDRNDAVIIDYKEGYIVDGGYKQQAYTDLDGNKQLIVSGVTIPALSSVVLTLIKGELTSKSAFNGGSNKLTTPFAKVEFSDRGYISSFIDTRINRELKGEGYDLNTFILAEDVPTSWDAWDVDADIEYKYRDVAKLISREVVSEGEVAYIIRSKYSLTKKTTITQDMIFFADNAEVRFDTIVDWNDAHRFLKTAFDTTIFSDFARQEVQFGYAKRPTTRNTTLEQAKFEILNHKYTDLSENRYGVAILNDCKYAISLNGGQLRLSLHKGGLRPDYRGDKGVHRMVYSFLPHNSGFDTNSVIKPAYELNYPPVIAKAEYEINQLIKLSAENIIVESIKPCEDNERAFILRLYEAEGTYTRADICLSDIAKSVELTNMLEEKLEELSVDSLSLEFRPFEIKTIKVIY